MIKDINKAAARSSANRRMRKAKSFRRLAYYEADHLRRKALRNLVFDY